jgi:hypothetical protein
MIEAYSYAYNSLSKDVLIYQKQIFDKFDLPIIQIQDNLNHGQFLTHILNTSKSKYVMFFDADAIPLTKNFYNIVLEELEKEKCIIGMEQTGMPRYHIYAGPACLAMPVSLYSEINYPCLNQTFRSDIGEEITWCCEERAIPVKFLKISHVESPKWRLGYDREFGIGSTYSYKNQDVLYHQFEIRLNTHNFIKKCINILENK